MAGIPVLDLRDYAAPDSAAGRAFARALRAALCDLGFVAIEGHGVDPSAIAYTYEVFERFFSSPDADKRRSSGVAGGQRGFTPFAVEHARDCAQPDLKEFFHVGRELAPGHALAGVYPDNVWPDSFPELRERALPLYAALDSCAAQLLRALADGLGLERERLASMLIDGNSILRALHYPPLAAGPPAGAMRAAPHEDINLITLLCEASAAGLEIQGRDGRWLPVETPAGRFIVDSGDMLCRVTGGVVPATTHRVVQPGSTASRQRFSLPFFAHPAPACDLTVALELRSPERLAAHPPTTAGDYLAERLSEIGLD